MPPSLSDTFALQTRLEDVSTPVDGLTLNDSIDGLEFTMLTLALPLSLPPSVSEAEAAQLRVSPGEAMVGVSVREETVPKEVLCVSFVQL